MPEEKSLEEKLGEVLEGDQAKEQSLSEEKVSEEKETPEEVSPEGEQAQEVSEEVEEEKIRIGDKEYTKDEIEKLIEKARNYDYLLPEFTRRSQRLAELEKQLRASASPEDKAKAEALKYLRENLGLLTREDLQEFMTSFAERLEGYLAEKEKLQDVVKYLEQKYPGGTLPKFDYEKLRNYLYEKYGQDKSQWPETIDLEYEYWQMNRDFFERLPETLKKRIVPTESKGVPASIVPPAKKIVEKPTKEGEISLEEAMEQMLGTLGEGTK